MNQNKDCVGQESIIYDNVHILKQNSKNKTISLHGGLDPLNESYWNYPSQHILMFIFDVCKYIYIIVSPTYI